MHALPLTLLQRHLGQPAMLARMGGDGVGGVLYLLAMSGAKPSDRWLDEVGVGLGGC